jgi:hypothetical protein
VAPSILLGREKLDKVIETTQYPAGPLPEGFSPELWAEVPPKVGPAVAEKLKKRFAINISEGELYEEHIQAVLKYFYYF